MSLYDKDDVSLLCKNIKDIQKEVDKEVLNVLEPKLQEMREVYNTILEYIKNHKRKLYGGFALNLLIIKQDPSDAIYDVNDKPPDIDFYSPEPLQDAVNICNILYQKKFKYVRASEAQHSETYSIFVNLHTPYCDISYVPKNIYNKMPFEQIDGFYVIHPHFMSIDYLRMLCDPIISFWRIEKAFTRFCLLQKHYPLPHNNHSLKFDKPSGDVEIGLNIVFDFLLKKETTITVGFYAHNYFLNESNLNNKKIQQLNIPFYEIISVDYRTDCLELIDKLKKNVVISGKINYQEYTRFFQFTGYTVEIFVEDTLIAIIYDHNKKCFPYQDVPAIKFSESDKKLDSNIRLGTFSMCLLYGMVGIIRARIFDDNDEKEIYYTLVSHFIDIRNYYFNKNKKTFLDKTIFKDFVVKCVGKTIKPDVEKRLKSIKRRKEGKAFTFNYEPAEQKDKPLGKYVFPNSSGNPITNPKYLKLKSEEEYKKDEEDNEEESETEIKSK